MVWLDVVGVRKRQSLLIIMTVNGAFPLMMIFAYLKNCVWKVFNRFELALILAKRENFRQAFAGFDFNKMAKFDHQDVERLLQDAGIIRHRGKIEAVINNAKRAQELVGEAGSLAAYFWQFEMLADDDFVPQSASTSTQSITLSKELKNGVGNLLVLQRFIHLCRQWGL